MSLQSACLELGGALRVAATRAGLALLAGFEAAYCLLGLVMPAMALYLLVSARRRADHSEAETRPFGQPMDG